MWYFKKILLGLCNLFRNFISQAFKPTESAKHYVKIVILSKNTTILFKGMFSNKYKLLSIMGWCLCGNDFIFYLLARRDLYNKKHVLLCNSSKLRTHKYIISTQMCAHFVFYYNG